MMDRPNSFAHEMQLKCEKDEAARTCAAPSHPSS